MYKTVNCLKCKKSFSTTYRYICDECYEIEKESIRKITSFFEENPDKTSTIQELSTELNIELSYLEDLHTNNKLSLLSNRIILKCSNCGKLLERIPNKTYLCGICMTQMGLQPNLQKNTAPTVQLKKFDKNIYHSKK